MKKKIQSVKLFNGQHSTDKIRVNQNEVSADDYNIALYGKIRNISRDAWNSPILSFPYFTKPSSAANTEYYLCGGYYFTKTDFTMKPLSDLNSYFGVTVDKVSFAGYLMHQTYKVMGLISIGKDMYMSNENYVYVRIGRKTDFIAENIISLFFAGSYYIAVDDRLNYYITTVIY